MNDVQILLAVHIRVNRSPFTRQNEAKIRQKGDS